MTFLEYVLTRELGQPTSRANGQSYWPCPQCNCERFGTLPHRENCKDRFKCHRCTFWGDAFDLLKELCPDKDYIWRRTRLQFLKQDFERDQPMDPQTAEPSSPGERGDMTRDYSRYSARELRELIAEQEFGAQADAAVAALLASIDGPGMLPVSVNDETAKAAVFSWSAEVLEVCAKFDLLPQALAGRLKGEAWFRERDARHLAECDDDECDAIVCRRARGLPPLTQQEIDAYKRERAAEKEERMARVRRAIKKPGANGRAK